VQLLSFNKEIQIKIHFGGDKDTMPQKILILGAGAAGSIAANKLARELRREIAEEKITINITG